MVCVQLTSSCFHSHSHSHSLSHSCSHFLPHSHSRFQLPFQTRHQRLPFQNWKGKRPKCLGTCVCASSALFNYTTRLGGSICPSRWCADSKCIVCGRFSITPFSSMAAVLCRVGHACVCMCTHSMCGVMF